MRKKIIEYTERWATGGIESYILNIAKKINPIKFDVRILAAQKESDVYDCELNKYGYKVESLLEQVCSNPIQRSLKTQVKLKKYLEKNKCDVLHLHISQGVALKYAKYAKKAGVKKVIIHCHNTEIGDGFKMVKMLGHCIGKRLYKKYIDEKIACSDFAAKWLFLPDAIKKNHVKIFKYMVDVEKFQFSQEKRREMRSVYNLTDEKIYLSIGRMHYQKNQLFLLDVFREIYLIEPDSRFVLIGTGERKEEIHMRAEKLGIYSNMIFIEKTREVPAYMWMADIFILPSLFEGNPIVATEAQAAGLPCYLSDSITRQAKEMETTRFISLNKTSQAWAEEICGSEEYLKMVDRSQAAKVMKRKGYDVMKQMKAIENIYDIN